MIKLKVTKKQIKKLKIYWKRLQNLQNNFNEEMYALEKEMSKGSGIKNLEFFYCDNECSGIGNAERTMRLILGKELEDEKE